MMIRVSTISFLAVLLLMALGYATYLHELGPEKVYCGVVIDEPKPFCGNGIRSRNVLRNRETETITHAEGKALFKANCSSCHARDMKTKLTGPALGGVEDRWMEYPREDLYGFIRNSEKMIHNKHPKAIKLKEEWQTVMNNFPNLTDDQIESILLFIDLPYY